MAKKLLDSIYLSPGKAGAFSTPLALYKEAKLLDDSITHKEVRNYLKNSHVYSVHRKRGKVKKYLPWVSTIADYLFFADLFFIKKSPYLCVVDGFTNQIYARSLRNKEPKNVAKAFESIIADDNDGKYCGKLVTDGGLEQRCAPTVFVTNYVNLLSFITEQSSKASLPTC